MEDLIAPSGNCARVKKTLILAAIVALVEFAPAPRNAVAAAGPDLSAMLPEFNRICADLTRAREELRVGALDEDTFADRVLALFVDADSLKNSLDSVGASTRRVGSPFFAMGHSLRYLIDSLRENYVGIVGRNGISFVTADQALQAAVAWRSGVGTSDGAESMRDAARP